MYACKYNKTDDNLIIKASCDIIANVILLYFYIVFPGTKAGRLMTSHEKQGYGPLDHPLKGAGDHRKLQTRQRYQLCKYDKEGERERMRKDKKKR